MSRYICPQPVAEEPPCELTCEEIQCEINAAHVNSDNLFSRTDDLNQGLNGLYTSTDIRFATTALALSALDGRVDTLEQEADVRTVKIVYTREELIAALVIGGVIYVGASIENLVDSLRINSNTTLIPLSPNNSKIVLKRPFNPAGISSGGSQQVLFIQGENVHIHPGFRIDGNHPLTSNPTTIVVGIYIASAINIDVSGLAIVGTEICNVSAGIMRSGGISALPMRNALIRENYIHSFCGPENLSGQDIYHGIIFSWQTRNLRILHNIIIGRVGTENHDVRCNGIWVGNLCDYLLLDGNFVDQVDRNAYEIFSTSAAGRGNLDPTVVNNVSGTTGYHTGWTGFAGSIAFSITNSDGTIRVIANKVGTVNGYAFEFASDATVGQGKFIVEGNSFDFADCNFGQAVGVSVDSRTNSVIGTDILMKGNVWGRVRSMVGIPNSLGMQIWFGCKRFFLDGDTFVDSGNINVYFNSQPTQTTDGVVVQNCNFYWSNPPLWPANSPSVWFQYTNSTVVLKNNTVHRPTGSSLGIFIANGPNTVKTGGAATADIVTTVAQVNVQGESNIFVDL